MDTVDRPMEVMRQVVNDQGEQIRTLKCEVQTLKGQVGWLEDQLWGVLYAIGVEPGMADFDERRREKEQEYRRARVRKEEPL